MNTGKQLEKDLVNALDNKYYKDLNQNLKQFIAFAFNKKKFDNKIYCKKLLDKQKADFVIKVDGEVKYISLKSGSQNSVHVEKVEKFANFLLNEGVKKEITKNLLLYHYGDDTLDGTGKIRYCADEAKIKYKKEIFEFNKYINYSIIITRIIERFLFVGTKNTNKYVDIIYYGDVNIGTWCTSKELLDFCKKRKSMYMNTPHFSVFTYQNWCRNVYCNKKSEPHRNYIQIKWFSILSDIRKIRQINDC